MALLPWWDIEATVAEVERIAASALRESTPTPIHKIRDSRILVIRYWEPMWEACILSGCRSTSTSVPA